MDSVFPCDPDLLEWEDDDDGLEEMPVDTRLVTLRGGRRMAVHRYLPPRPASWRFGESTWAPYRGDSRRVLFWHPPLILVMDRALGTPLANAIARAIADGGATTNPHKQRFARILGTAESRAAHTRQRHAEIWVDATRAGEEAVHLMQPCGWCGEPTGAFCDGFNDGWSVVPPEIGFNDGRAGWWQCRQPICSVCDKMFSACPCCSLWVGLRDMRSAPYRGHGNPHGAATGGGGAPNPSPANLEVLRVGPSVLQ